jgi:hypothetical protein
MMPQMLGLRLLLLKWPNAQVKGDAAGGAEFFQQLLFAKMEWNNIREARALSQSRRQLRLIGQRREAL